MEITYHWEMSSLLHIQLQKFLAIPEMDVLVRKKWLVSLECSPLRTIFLYYPLEWGSMGGIPLKLVYAVTEITEMILNISLPTTNAGREVEAECGFCAPLCLLKSWLRSATIANGERRGWAFYTIQPPLPFLLHQWWRTHFPPSSLMEDGAWEHGLHSPSAFAPTSVSGDFSCRHWWRQEGERDQKVLVPLCPPSSSSGSTGGRPSIRQEEERYVVTGHHYFHFPIIGCSNWELHYYFSPPQLIQGGRERDKDEWFPLPLFIYSTYY